MEILEHKDLSNLLAEQQGPSVSIFMPTYQKGREVQQNPVRLKNLLTRAEESLEQVGLRSAESRSLLAPAGDLLEDYEFWKYQKEGLALFLSGASSWYCQVPFHLDELVVANQDRFHIKPILPLLTEDGAYYVLTLSQQQVRLLECRRFSARELDLEKTSIPLSVEEALQYDDPERQLQFRSNTGFPSQQSSRWGAVFHGHGIEDQQKEDLRRYFLQIDQGVRDVIGHGGVPLVLAGVDYLLPIYAETNKYGDLMDEGITGNAERLLAEELHEKSWPIVEPLFTEERERAAESYREKLGTGLASYNVEEIVPAAHQGRVDTLFASVGMQIWGTFDAYAGKVCTRDELRAGDEDLSDLAAFLTLTNGGKVFAVDQEAMPDSHPLAAVFRY